MSRLFSNRPPQTWPEKLRWIETHALPHEAVGYNEAKDKHDGKMTPEVTYAALVTLNQMYIRLGDIQAADRIQRSMRAYRDLHSFASPVESSVLKSS